MKLAMIGSYQTAWANRLRSVLVRPGRDRLAGLVVVDETFIGGEESGCAAAGPGQEAASRWRSGNRRASADAGCAVGRCVGRLAARVRDRRAGPRVITDGWQGYQGLEKLGYVQPAGRPDPRGGSRRAPARGAPDRLTIKRWLLGHARHRA